MTKYNLFALNVRIQFTLFSKHTDFKRNKMCVCVRKR